MAIVFATIDANSMSMEADLDDELYYVILDWNETFQSWEMGIRNSAYQTLVDGISVVPNYPLLWQFKYPELPPGDIYAETLNLGINGPVPRDGFITEKFQLVYYDAAEMLVAKNAV